MVFWIVSVVLALAVCALLAMALLGRQDEGPSGGRDVDVYRDQLAEVERDTARGVLNPEEAERLRIEVSRRLLEADKEAATRRFAGAPRGATLAAAGVTAVAVIGVAFLTYVTIGAPGYPDLPLAARIEAADAARAARPDQATAQATLPPGARIEMPRPDAAFLQLMEQLRQVTQERPEDLQGQMLLAQNEARLGEFAAAHAAQARVIAIKGDAATAQDYADLADMMILAAGGYVSPEAEAALTQALRRDARNGAARYYSGLMFAQTGRPDLAFRLWEQLLRDSRPDAPWIPPIREQIEDVAADAGVRFELSAQPEAEAPAGAPLLPPASGPTREQVEAAQDMTPEQRMEMIRGMVGGLSERLASEGGPPEDWARLIGALAVLGETAQAGEIWTEAQAVFADAPEALELVRAAAARAGLAP